MNDGPQPPIPPQENPESQPATPPQAGQVPPIQTPLASLAPPPGGGSKAWIIMGILAVLIGGGIWMLSSMKKNGDDEVAIEEKQDVPKPKPKPKPRKAEKTTERPFLEKEMVELSSKNPDDFEKNIGKWVRLKGEVETGNADGVLIFKDPAKMTGQLVKGSAEHLSGKIVKVFGWMIAEEKIQIDGIFDINIVDPVDLLPKKDVYTIADGEQLVSLRNTKATFEGKVKSVRVSGDKKNLYLVFEGESYEFFGSGNIDKLKKVEVTEETLKELIGKTIKLTGKLEFKKQEEKDRIIINFSDKENYEVVE